MKQSSVVKSLKRGGSVSRLPISRIRMLWISLMIPIGLIVYMNFSSFIGIHTATSNNGIANNDKDVQQSQSNEGTDMNKDKQEEKEPPPSSSYTYPYQLHYLNVDGSTTTKRPEQLISSQNTVVTAYFSTKSKASGETYNKWMENMLALPDAMIIYTQPSMVQTISQFRQHALDRTVLVSMELEDLPYAKWYTTKQWEAQFELDFEKRIHRSYQLFWIWLSKTWYVSESITTLQNPFKSDVFMYSDIGCFRRKNILTPGQPMIQHREVIPRHAMLQMAHHKPNPPPTHQVWWNDKRTQPQHFYHSGSQMVAYEDTWIKFHEYFVQVVDGFFQRNMFVGEDQAVLQSTCLQHPDICEYIPFTQVRNDNHYFGLRTVVHRGGAFEPWKPPSLDV